MEIGEYILPILTKHFQIFLHIFYSIRIIISTPQCCVFVFVCVFVFFKRVVCMRAANSGSIRESAGALRPMRRKCCVLVDKGKQTEMYTKVQKEIQRGLKRKTEIQ